MSKQLAKNTLIFTFFTVLRKIVGIILIPIYTALLSPEDYGQIGVLTSVVTFMTIFFGLSVRSAMVRLYHKYKNDNAERIPYIWGNSIIIYLVFSIFLFGIIILSRSFIESIIIRNIDFFPLTLTAFVSAFFGVMFENYQSILIAQMKAKQHGIQNFSYFLINLGLTLFFIIWLRMGIYGVIYATAITNLLFFLYASWQIVRVAKVNRESRIYKEILSYSLPLLPHNLSSWTAAMIDRFFLSNIAGFALTGLYHLGSRYASLFNVVRDSFSRAYSPWFFSMMDQGKTGEEKVIQVASVIMLIISPLGLFITFISPVVLKLFTPPEYFEAYKVIPLLVFTVVFQFIYIFVAGPLYLRKTGVFSIISVGGACLNVVLNVILIPRYGMIGAGTATLIEQFLKCIFYAIIGYKYEGVKFNWIHLFVVPVIFFLISLTVYFFDTITIEISMILSFFSILLIVLIALLNRKIFILLWRTFFHKKSL